MDKFRSFFEEKKLDSKFKKAGEGHKLEDSGAEKPSASGSAAASAAASSRQPVARGASAASSEATASAAIAAVARHEQQQRSSNVSVTGSAFRKKAAAAAAAPADPVMPADHQRSANVPGLGGGDSKLFPIRLICPKCGQSFGRLERVEHLDECLSRDLATDPLSTAATMMKTLPTNQTKVQECITTVAKYLQNLAEHPDERKYSRIRVGNAALQKKVLSCPGAMEFFQAVGFVLTQAKRDVVGEQQEDVEEEDFLIMDEERLRDAEFLEMARDMLLKIEPLKPQLDRGLKVLRVSQNLSRFHLPPAFFRLTAEELKKEYERKKQTVESLSELKTQAMRERDVQANTRKYRYCVLRIRLPDTMVLQAIFYPTETISEVRKTISSAIREELQACEFEIYDPTGRLVKDDSLTLLSALWVPHAIINVRFPDSPLRGDARILSIPIMKNPVTDY